MQLLLYYAYYTLIYRTLQYGKNKYFSATDQLKSRCQAGLTT